MFYHVGVVVKASDFLEVCLSLIEFHARKYNKSVMNRQVKGVIFDLSLKYIPLTNGLNDIHCISIFGYGMEGGKPMFEFSHLADGAGKSFVPRLKVKGKG